MLTIKNLSPAQKQAVRDIINRKVGCLAPECGAGKTAIFLTTYKVLMKQDPDIKALVVCTPSGVKTTWSTEHLKWNYVKDLNVVPLIGNPEQRTELLSQNANVYVVSYNSLKWLSENNSHRFQFVFADEGACLKGPMSKWRKYLIACAPHAERRIISTATPKTKDAMDFFGLCKYMDNGESLGAPNITTFRNRYCYQIPTGKAGFNRWVVNKSMVPEIEEKVKHLFWSYETDEEAIVPHKLINVKASLTPDSLEKYKTLKKEQCVNSIITDKHGKINREESLNAMVLSGKLSELSSGFVYVDDSLRLSDDVLKTIVDPEALLRQVTKRKAIDIFDDRMVAFKKLVAYIHNEHGSSANVCFSYLYKHDLSKLKAAFPEAVSDDEDDIVDRWNSGNVKYLLLQYGRSAKSLNLQDGGFILASYSMTFNWEQNYQIIRRLARRGQKADMVYFYRLVMRETIDERKIDVLKERGDGHVNFQSIIKRETNFEV